MSRSPTRRTGFRRLITRGRADISDSDLAHEIGHQVGLRDESGFDSAAPHRGGTSSLMGDPTRFTPASDPAYASGGLRPRHLALIGTLVGDPADDHRGPGRRGPVKGAPGADPPAPVTPTVDQADQGDTAPPPVATTSAPVPGLHDTHDTHDTDSPDVDPADTHTETETETVPAVVPVPAITLTSPEGDTTSCGRVGGRRWPS